MLMVMMINDDDDNGDIAMANDDIYELIIVSYVTSGLHVPCKYYVLHHLHVNTSHIVILYNIIA